MASSPDDGTAARSARRRRDDELMQQGRTADMITLTGSPALKVQVMCEGIRYTPALAAAAAHSMPNYYPYRFKEASTIRPAGASPRSRT
jgi:hypothetical protein